MDEALVRSHCGAHTLSNSIQIIGPRGNTLSVHAQGEGPTLFLLHGFPLDYRMWQFQLAELSNRMHVVAVSFRGFGNSTLDEPVFTLAELAQDVEFLRQHLAGDESILLAGLSMGGCVAFEYWRQFPNRLRGLILCNTRPTAESETGRATRRAIGQTAREKGTWAAVEPMFSKLVSEQTIASQPEIAEFVRSMMQGTSPATVVAAQHALAERREFTDHLPTIRVPTLVIAGESDAITPPADALTWSRQIPNCTCQVVPNTAHLSPLEAPGVVNRAIQNFADSIQSP